MYYTAIEALTLGILAGNRSVRHHLFQSCPATVCHTFHHRVDRAVPGPAFSGGTGHAKWSRSHPDPNVNWSQYEPISGIPAYAATNRIPYVEEYMLSLQRQLGANTVLSVSYVGTQSHRLLVMEEANAGDPALCLSLSQRERRGSDFPNLRSFWRKQCFHDGFGSSDRRERAGPWVLISAATRTRQRSGNPITTLFNSACVTPADDWNCRPDTPTASRWTSLPIWGKRSIRSILHSSYALIFF